ncbi:MAG: hypothetical protein AB3N33_06600 [Puniceicoccaceae bacterium]
MRWHWIVKAVMVVLGGLGSLFLFFRYFILSGGKWIVGDSRDGQLIACLHEHWFRVFQGKEGWFELGFFYPAEHVLGYSDTFLLGGMIHSLFRFAGLDLYLAFQMTQITCAATGFAGMVLWLCRYRKMGTAFVLLGSVLLLVASPVYISSRNTHIQLQAVWIMPWVAILLEQAWRDIQNNPGRLYYSFSGLCLLYGLVAYSAFYIAWFCFLFLIVWFVVALCLLDKGGIWEQLKRLPNFWLHFFPGMLIAFGWLSLFLITYLPVRVLQGGRTLGESIKSLPYPWDFINHSKSNLLWGKVNNHLPAYHDFRPWELELGPTPIFAVLVVATGIALWRRRATLRTHREAWYLVTGIALIISFLMIMRLGLLSFWILPYSVVPGADGIRVSIRFMVFLVVPAIPVILWGLRELAARSPKRAGGLLVALLSISLLAEQIHLTPNAHMNRIEMLQTMESLPDPPVDATAWIPFTRKTGNYEILATQSSAIGYAQHWSLPTCGGRSGFEPVGWTLSQLNPPEVFSNALQWVSFKEARGNLYFFDVDNNEWGKQLPAAEDPKNYFWLNHQDNNNWIGVELTQLTPLLFGGLTIQGWSRREDWGAWSVSKVAEIMIPEFEREHYPLRLNLEFGAYVTEIYPEQRVRIFLNEEEVYHSVFTHGDPPVILSLSIQEGARLLRIETPDATSPNSIGNEGDNRNLGIALRRFEFTHW